MKEKLLIIGASGHGKVIADIALRMNKWNSIAFLDDNETLKASMGLAVIGKSTDAFEHLEDSDIFIGIGSNALRERLTNKLEEAGVTIPVLIHPSAVIGQQVELGAGTAVMAGAVINCCTRLGKGCIVNTGATIDHDNIICDFAHISPGASLAGTVTIGSGTWLGVGSTVSNNISITGNCIIGAGAVVIKDINESGTYVGVPARRIK